MYLLLFFISYLIFYQLYLKISSYIFNNRKNKYKDLNYNYPSKRVIEDIFNKNDIKNNEIEIKETDNLNGYHISFYSKENELRLSSEVLHNSNPFSLLIAAHEASHLVQDYKGYIFMKIYRKITIPNILFSVLFLISLINYFIFKDINSDLDNQITVFVTLQSIFLVSAILLYILLVLSYILSTVMIEYNANKQAIKYLYEYSFVNKLDMKEIKKFAFFNSMLSYVLYTPICFVGNIIFVIENWRKFFLPTK